MWQKLQMLQVLRVFWGFCFSEFSVKTHGLILSVLVMVASMDGLVKHLYVFCFSTSLHLAARVNVDREEIG